MPELSGITSRAGQAPENGFVESFNGRLRDERLNEEAFASLAQARVVIERWRLDDNRVRPHSAHGGLTPNAVRLNPAAGGCETPTISAARPLPSAQRKHPKGSHNERGTGGGRSDRLAAEIFRQSDASGKGDVRRGVADAELFGPNYKRHGRALSQRFDKGVKAHDKSAFADEFR